MQPFNYPPQHQFQPQAQPYQQMAGYHYYYDPSTMLPPPTPASAPHAPHQHPQHQPFHPFPPGPPPAQVRPTKPPITRSPRPANGSGGRMQNFVFPLPPGSGSKQSPHVPQPSTTSSLGSGSTHGSAGPGVTSLPPKPNFEPSGGLETSRDASSAMLNTATPMASTSSVGSVLPRDPSRTSGRTELGKEVLEHLPPLPPLVPEPSKRPAKEQQSEEMSAYVESVLASLASYKLREDAMQQRIEALAFRPAQAWRALSQQRQNTDGTTEAAVPDDADHDDISSITGVRLLTKVVQLQAENDELGSLLESKLQTIQSGTGDSRLQQELQGELGPKQQTLAHFLHLYLCPPPQTHTISSTSCPLHSH